MLLPRRGDHSRRRLLAVARGREGAKNLDELWGNYDPRKDPLETTVVREWKEGSVTCRYVVFTIGTFKGRVSRMAAFYAFPTGAEEKLPGLLDLHGGGQEGFVDRSHLPGAERLRGAVDQLGRESDGRHEGRGAEYRLGGTRCHAETQRPLRHDEARRQDARRLRIAAKQQLVPTRAGRARGSHSSNNSPKSTDGGWVSRAIRWAVS